MKPISPLSRWAFLFLVPALGTPLLSTLAAGQALSFLDKWGTGGAQPGQFSSPSGIAVDAAGNVYVADTGNQRIQKFLGNGVFVQAWGTSGAGNGQFDTPRGVAVDGGGNVYVADTGNNRIQKFSDSGAYLFQWGTTGTGDGEFIAPRSLTVDGSGFVYVTEDGFASKRVQKFTSSGTFVTKWGSIGSGDGQFTGPRGIAVDESSYVYVSDTLNDRVQKFTGSGSFVTKWGTPGGNPGQFSLPIGVAWRENTVLIVDSSNHRLQEFTRTGSFVSQLGTRCDLGTSAGCVDPDAGGPLDLGDGQFNFPQSAAMDHHGNLFVLDAGNSRVEKFGPSVVIGIGDGEGPGPLVRVFPNPFFRATHVSFHLPRASSDDLEHDITLRVFDLTGREIRRLHAGRFTEGDHAVSWDGTAEDGTAVPYGLFFVTLEVDGRAEHTAKLVRVP